MFRLLLVPLLVGVTAAVPPVSTSREGPQTLGPVVDGARQAAPIPPPRAASPSLLPTRATHTPHPPTPNASNQQSSPSAPGKRTCEGGFFTEATLEELALSDTDQRSKLPHVQCWRNPPCVRDSWLTPEKCAACA